MIWYTPLPFVFLRVSLDHYSDLIADMRKRVAFLMKEHQRSNSAIISENSIESPSDIELWFEKEGMLRRKEQPKNKICEEQILNLKRIIALKKEVNTQLDVYANDIKVSLYSSEHEMLQNAAKENDAALLVAATDVTIALGKKLGIATIAYANPVFPNQTYRDVEMLIEGFEEIDLDFLEKQYQRFHNIPWTILETERCIVRELSLDDMDELFALYADKEITRYTEGLYPYEEEFEFQRAYINHMYRFFGYGMWLVFSKENRALIGRAGLEHREYDEETELELGYVIGTKYQRQGYATEVCTAILKYAKEQTEFVRINCLIEQENGSSIRLAEKLGFHAVGKYKLDEKNMYRFENNC